MRKRKRGIRNNNPGNIRESLGDRTQWQGERATDDDAAFEEFVSPEYGIRAMARILDNYRSIYGLNTVRSIIDRWAPGEENPTDEYVDFVAKRLGVGPDDGLIPWEIYRVPLVAAIIRFENGYEPYSLATIEQGVMMA